MNLLDHNLILFNQDWLSTAKLEEVILTPFHESRYAYQKAQIDGVQVLKVQEKPETIVKWKRKFYNIIDQAMSIRMIPSIWIKKLREMQSRFRKQT